jgi:FkbM family methyltransferase
MTEIYYSDNLFGRKVNGKINFYCRYNRADEITFLQVFRDQDYNVGHLVRGKELVELASKLGENASAIFFAESFPQAKVIVVEPDKGNFDVLLRNINSLKQVTPICGAVAQEDGWVVIENPNFDPNGFRTKSVNISEGAIQAYAISSLVKQVGGIPFLLKIDIEGAEDVLFAGNFDSIKEFPIVAVEIHDWMLPNSANSQNFLKWHVLSNRDMVIRGETLFSIKNDLVMKNEV